MRNVESEQVPTPAGPRILLFDLSRHAHLPSYLHYLIESWCERDAAGSLDILVWHTFLQERADVVSHAERAPRRNVRFVTLTASERREKEALESDDATLKIPFHNLLKIGARAPYAAVFDWQLLGRYARRLAATRSFVIHVDHYLPLLAAGFEVPGPLSGIYFGPTFHYGDPAGVSSVPSGGPVQRLGEKFVLARVLRQPQLGTLFFLDRFAAEHAGSLPHGKKVTFLADPVKLDPVSPERVTALRNELGIESSRTVFLLFGQLARRKGIAELLEAIQRLPADDCGRICLALVGTIHPTYRAQLDVWLEALLARCPVQVVTRYDFIPQADLPAYFQFADVVLAPYLRHAGMSGILLLAAAAGKPVLSSSWGLMGELTRRYRLGLTVDATESGVIAAALQRFVRANPSTLCDPAQMRQLAEEHHADHFGATLLQHFGVVDVAS